MIAPNWILKVILPTASWSGRCAEGLRGIIDVFDDDSLPSGRGATLMQQREAAGSGGEAILASAIQIIF